MYDLFFSAIDEGMFPFPRLRDSYGLWESVWTPWISIPDIFRSSSTCQIKPECSGEGRVSRTGVSMSYYALFPLSAHSMFREYNVRYYTSDFFFPPAFTWLSFSRCARFDLFLGPLVNETLFLNTSLSHTHTVALLIIQILLSVPGSAVVN